MFKTSIVLYMKEKSIFTSKDSVSHVLEVKQFSSHKFLLYC